MNTDEVCGVLDTLKQVGCISLILSGGEIFARKDIVKILQYARASHFALRLFTNGTLIDRAMAEAIAQVKPWVVEISLYGFRDVHEQVTRVKGSFDDTVRAIEILRGRQIRVYVKSVVMKQNWAELPGLQQYVQRKLKVQWRSIDGGLQISPCDNGSKRPFLFRLSDRQLEKYMLAALTLNKTAKRNPEIRAAGENEHVCGAAFTACNITPSGELNPCLQIRAKDNSLKSKSFTEIWQEHPLFRQLRSLRRGDRQECLGCKDSVHCFLCPGMALIERGSLSARSPEACRLARGWKNAYRLLDKHLA